MPAETRGEICCWTPAETPQFQGRLFHPFRVAGSCCVSGIALPKVGVSHGPHSPLASGFWKLHCGMLSFGPPTPSLTLMDVLVANDEPGFSNAAVAIVSPATPRAAENLIAVLPVPNRSYTAPNRGLTSFQSATVAPGMVCTARFGRYSEGPLVDASYDS